MYLGVGFCVGFGDMATIAMNAKIDKRLICLALSTIISNVCAL